MNLYKQWADRLRKIAIEDHKNYPQYNNYYDFWVLAEGRRTMKYTGGSVLCKKRIVLANPELTAWYDPDTGHECGVNDGDLYPLV